MFDFWHFPRKLRLRSEDRLKAFYRSGVDEIAGWSLSLDMWGVGCRPLADITSIFNTLERAAEEDGSIILERESHQFGTGVFATVILADGHISIRTWPEQGVAVVDAFSPHAGGKKVGVMRTHFRPEGVHYTEAQRGSLAQGEVAKKAAQHRS